MRRFSFSPLAILCLKSNVALTIFRSKLPPPTCFWALSLEPFLLPKKLVKIFSFRVQKLELFKTASNSLPSSHLIFSMPSLGCSISGSTYPAFPLINTLGIGLMSPSLSQRTVTSFTRSFLPVGALIWRLANQNDNCCDEKYTGGILS